MYGPLYEEINNHLKYLIGIIYIKTLQAFEKIIIIIFIYRILKYFKKLNIWVKKIVH